MNSPYLQELGLLCPTNSSSCLHGYLAADPRTCIPGAPYPYNVTAVFIMEELKNNMEGDNVSMPGMATFSRLHHAHVVDRGDTFINANTVKACVMIGTDLCRILCGPNHITVTKKAKLANTAKWLSHIILLMEDFLDFNGSAQERRQVLTEFNPGKLPKVAKGMSKAECPHCVVRFYDSRNSCSTPCLNQAKLVNKTCRGKCRHCEQFFLTTQLSTCSGCLVERYCSRECQVAAWPTHKFFCKEFKKEQKRQQRSAANNA